MGSIHNSIDVKRDKSTTTSIKLKFVNSAKDINTSIPKLDNLHFDKVLLLTFLESFNSVAFILKTKTREIIATNEAAKKIGALVGNTCYKAWANSNSPCRPCRASELWKNGEPVHCNIESQGKNWLSHWIPISDELYLHYIEDINAPKQTVKEILSVSNELQDGINKLNIAQIIWDKDKTTLEWNYAAEQIFGYTSDEIIGKQLFDAIVRKDVIHLVDQVAEDLFEGNPSTYSEKNNNVRKDGQRITCLWHNTPICDSNGKVTHILSTAQDITKKLADEENQKKQNYYLNKAQEIGKIGTWEFDLICEELIWTDEIYHIFGVPLGTNIDTELFLTILHPEDKDIVEQAWESSLNGKAYDIEFRIIVEERIKWVREKGDFICDDQGTPFKAIGFTQEITEEKQVELELQKAKNKIQKKSDDLGKRVKELNCLYGISALVEKNGITIDEIIQGTVELIPPAWQYPEKTCAKIKIENKTYLTENFIKTKWKQSCDLNNRGEIIGNIEVYYIQNKLNLDEKSFLDERKSLLNAISEQLGHIIERYESEHKLKKSLINLENRVKERTSELENTKINLLEEIIERKEKEKTLLVTQSILLDNKTRLSNKDITITEVLNQIDMQKDQTKIHIQNNINRLILPTLKTIKNKLDPSDYSILDLLEANLLSVSEPFINQLELNYAKLTPREIEVCNMLKNGMSSKDIAHSLNLSINTIHTQRRRIRKKLGINDTKSNLITILKSI